MGKRKRGVRIPTRAIIAVLMILLEIGILVYFSWKLSEKSFWVYTVAEVVSIFTVIYIINRKGNPNYKIMWIIFILLVPYIGVLTFLLWGGGRVFPYIKRHFERIVAAQGVIGKGKYGGLACRILISAPSVDTVLEIINHDGIFRKQRKREGECEKNSGFHRLMLQEYAL